MKIHALSILLMFVLTTQICYSQDSLYKPVAKNFTCELNFVPFSSVPINISYLRFRFFASETIALRMGLLVGVKNEKPGINQEQTSFEFNLRPGLEKHFKGTERLSPYVGFELDYAKKSSRFSDENQNVSIVEVEGAWTPEGQERGFSRIGANIIIGTDYYFSKRIYIGTEFGFGFQSVKSTNVSIDYNSAVDHESRGAISFTLGPNFNSALRLGFVL